MDIIIGLVIGLVIGAAIGAYFAFQRGQASGKVLYRHEVEEKIGGAKQESERLLAEAEREIAEKRQALAAEHQSQNEKLHEREQASFERIEKREASLEKKEQHLEQAQKERERDHKATQDRLIQREKLLDKRSENLDARETDLTQRDSKIEKMLKKAQNLHDQRKEALEQAHAEVEKLANLTSEQAREKILDEARTEGQLLAAKITRDIESEAKLRAEQRAKYIIGMAIQRYAGEYTTERCVRAVSLPNDDVKGRIIGREGRNIRSIEAATGVDLIVDDTPETVVISAFDPVRREIAAETLRRLIADGRIHPGRIEDTANKVRNEINQRIHQAGEQAFFDLGLGKVDAAVVKMFGRLKYRTSYGQNIWSHSIEAGWLCGMMAADLGLNVKLARRAGLLHDIGKAMDHEQEGSHAIIGAEFLKKHGEDPIVVNAVAAHHAEVPPESIYAPLAAAADAISGARPGARREILETYLQRLNDIEQISLSFDGVEKCYAIQAGHEIRVIVSPNKIDDAMAATISHQIARRIEQELTYPGQIKVCVIRETRAVETAK